ncbi:sirohydrochlorin cobaltochelatase [Salidesulfovibrio brasiliensis]|nr:sirohydrochlorin cobaltochelatase [Salidesulfovibrio brasiliensis]
MNKAIVLAAYGSRHIRAAAAMENMCKRVRELWPDMRLETIVASHHIRVRLEEEGEDVESMEELFDRLRTGGVSRVAIQSLHVIPGGGFDTLRHRARQAMKQGFERVEVGDPLLGAETDDELERVADAIRTQFAPEADNHALLLMGHGSRHHSHSYYERLDGYLREHVPHAHIGAMKLEPSLDTVIARFRTLGITSVTLQPLMFAAGYHVAEDMSGNSTDSWQTRLEAEGFTVTSVKRGLGQYDAFANIWLDHLADAIRFLG